MNLRSRIELVVVGCWYGTGVACFLWRWMLAPFSLLFLLLSGLRRLAYRYRLLRSVRLPVPVVVIGNMTAGGAGKTPLTLALVALMRRRGLRPGIVSRGFGGDARRLQPVYADSPPQHVGDEPVLLARRSDCPVWVGRDRAAAARALLTQHPEVDVIVADDGLQHYALQRDIEVVVIDAVREFGNGWLLPAGPLRELPGRLRDGVMVVRNGAPREDDPRRLEGYCMQLSGSRCINLRDPAIQVPLSELASAHPLHALAGIGHPQRFFDALANQGLHFDAWPFPDHHDYQVQDLPAGTVLMTEKDAVKCAPLAEQAQRDDCWYLPVEAILSPDFEETFLSRLSLYREGLYGSQVA